MFIEFGIKILNYKNLIIFLFPFLLVSKKRWQKKIKNNNKFYIIFINFISYILCGIIHLLSKYLSKSKNIDSKINELKDFKNKPLENSNSLRAQLIETMKSNKIEKLKKEKNQTIINILFIFLLSSLELIASFIQSIFEDNKNRQLNHSLLVLLELIFLIIFSMLFLNYSLYRHQFLSFGIFFICHIIFLIQSINNLILIEESKN